MTVKGNDALAFDLTPHPRILPMLGEIVLPQWRCLAELIDNSIDSFIEANRAQVPLQDAVVTITIPTSDAPGSRVSVRDNGPGMDSHTLQLAAKAGWTSHDPINNLGLFGMGFNIATARLGSRTTIWTTRSGDLEWVGLEIDFDQLVRRQAFVTPALSRVKHGAELSGTEVIIDRLKPDQSEWFGKAYNRSNTSKQLGRIYSSMIGPAADPLEFRLEINRNQVRPKLHCIWGGPGNPERIVETTRHGALNAFQPIDVRLHPRPFCIQCWNWLSADQTECPSCGQHGVIVQRERRVHGWLGLQRYLDRNDFGIDLLRNGRKIEIGNKDLFKWFDESSNNEEIEYPIDDPRDRGRIVGEIHLDHCRVPYTKDRFVREDSAWREMVEIVRGTTPLRPDIAASMGAGENLSPLFRLFQAFRRSNPHNRRAGGWNRILVVPDNDRAQSMARRYDAGESEFSTDDKWWELVEEAEAEVLRGGKRRAAEDETLGGTGDGTEEGSSDENSETNNSTTTTVVGSGTDGAGAPPRFRVASLSSLFIDDLTGQRFEVEAFSVGPEDPAIAGLGCPWSLRKTAAGPWEHFVDIRSIAFRSMTLTPLDGLLAQIAWQASDFERGQGSRWSYGAILIALRQKYARASIIDPDDLVSDASSQLVDIARSIVGRITSEDSQAFFDSLSPTQQENVRVAMASRAVTDPHGALEDGRFLQYAAPNVVSQFVLSNPSLFFDERYWDQPYETLDYGSSIATDEARQRLLNHYAGLLADAVWLAQQSPSDLESIRRERLLRASLATTLLAPTAAFEADS